MTTLLPIDVHVAAAQALDAARASSAGRSASALVSEPAIRCVLIALTSGSRLADHGSPPGATIHCLIGRVRVTSVSGAGQDVSTGEDVGTGQVVGSGELVVVPSERHGVEALDDSVILLTVALFGPADEVFPSDAGPQV
jgi:hypothetical protein